jgi:3-oxoacyl-[acyl-carrier protein] reductase
MDPSNVRDHVALVTGGNHGIGAAAARALAARGTRVVVSYLRLSDAVDPGIPDEYRRNRAADAEPVLTAIREEGGHAVAVEADLADSATPAHLFDFAESQFGPVDILINNASAWLADTFVPSTRDRLGRNSMPVTADSFDRQFASMRAPQRRSLPSSPTATRTSGDVGPHHRPDVRRAEWLSG